MTKAHRLLYPSTLGLRIIKKKKRSVPTENAAAVPCAMPPPPPLVRSRYFVAIGFATCSLETRKRAVLTD